MRALLRGSCAHTAVPWGAQNTKRAPRKLAKPSLFFFLLDELVNDIGRRLGLTPFLSPHNSWTPGPVSKRNRKL